LVNCKSTNLENNNIDLEIKQNITLLEYNGNININNNKFYGLVPLWFCNLDITFSNNHFQYQLPSCFTCFLNNPLIRDKVNGNNFTNYKDDMTPSQYPPCSSLTLHYYALAKVNPKSTMYLYDTKYVFYIFGNDLGIQSNIEIKERGFTVKMLKPNEIYFIELDDISYAKLRNISLLHVTFVDPGVTLVLDISKVVSTILEYNSPLLDPYVYDHNNPPIRIPLSTPSPTPTPHLPQPSSSETTTTSSPYEPTSNTNTSSEEVIGKYSSVSISFILSPRLHFILFLTLIVVVVVNI